MTSKSDQVDIIPSPLTKARALQQLSQDIPQETPERMEYLKPGAGNIMSWYGNLLQQMPGERRSSSCLVSETSKSVQIPVWKVSLLQNENSNPQASGVKNASSKPNLQRAVLETTRRDTGKKVVFLAFCNAYLFPFSLSLYFSLLFSSFFPNINGNSYFFLY